MQVLLPTLLLPPPQVKLLRPLARLQSLCLAGNPLASEDGYQHFAIAFIPSLVFLDFKMIFTEKVNVCACSSELELGACVVWCVCMWCDVV